MVRLRYATLSICLSACFMQASTAVGETVEEFYRGKQVKFIIHSNPGGAYDSWARLIAPYISKYLPGTPTVLPQNMPGAGGIIAANHLYLRAPRDGSVIGMIGRNLPYQAAMKVENVKYDPAKFNWIGSPELGNSVCVVRGDAPATTAADLYDKEILMGGAGAGTAVSVMPVVLNRLLGMKLKLVEGYGSSTKILLAMDRKEVHGVFLTLTSVQNSRGDALKSGDLKILFNMERKRVPELNAPSIFEFAKTEEQRKLLALLSVSSEVGRPMLAPPEVPMDRVAALREAFNKSMQDKTLQADANKLGLPITSVATGEDLDVVIKDLMSTSPELIAKMETLQK